jgi:hypothetical protein
VTVTDTIVHTTLHDSLRALKLADDRVEGQAGAAALGSCRGLSRKRLCLSFGGDVG